MSEKPNFYAIVPANVRYDKRLTNGAKLLYGEITALSSHKGYCWATNAYFAGLYEVSNTTISTWVGKLVECGHVKRVIKYKEGSKEIEGRYLSILNGGIQENLHTPIQENLIDSTTSFSTTSINTSNKDTVGKPDIAYSEIIDYLNLKTGKNYRSTTKAHQRHIKARVNEGFTLDDFKKVIDNKVSDNKKGIFQEMYLRPETLFGSKFDGYLNQESNEPIGYDPNKDAF